MGELRNLLDKVKPDQLESLAARSAFDGGSESVGLDQVEVKERDALRKLQNGEFDQITEGEAIDLEAIVQRELFPVSFIRNGAFEALSAPWQHFNSDPIRPLIEAAIASVGRVEYLTDHGQRAEHLGTGFIVGDRLMMTSRNVAEFFVTGAGLGPLTFKSGPPGVFDLGREKDFQPTDLSGSLRITGIRMVHPYWNMALMELDRMPTGVKPLLLSLLAPEELAGHEIAKIGYPAVLGRSDRLQKKGVELERLVLGDVGGVKRMAPGTVTGRMSISSYGRSVPALHYETSAVAGVGMAGAPLLDVHTGHVVGVAFASSDFLGSYAVPAYDLAGDLCVGDAGVAFAGKVPPVKKWEAYWTPPPQPPSSAIIKGVGSEPPPAGPEGQPAAAAGQAQPYPDGSISERLARLRREKETAAPGADPLQRFRHAAAVLVAFDPKELQPFGPGAIPDRAAALKSLEIDLIRNLYDEDGDLDDRLWSLDTGPRRQALRELQTAQAMRQALAVNRDRIPPLSLQKLLNRAIEMSPPFDPNQMDMVELTALATISGWLEDTEPGQVLPNPIDLVQLIERRRDRALLNRLASDTFTGREEERALIQAHLNSEVPRVLFVAGIGGMGKSALISRALLDWENLGAGPNHPSAWGGRLWVRVDMDHSLVAPERPRSVLNQAAQQMMRSHPELQSLLQRYIQEGHQLRRSGDQTRLESANVDSDYDTADRFVEILESAFVQPHSRVVLWLDTFEEAQFLGAAVADRLLNLAVWLARKQPRLRLVVSGRVPPPAVERMRQKQKPRAAASGPQALQVFTVTEPPLQALILQALPGRNATVLLDQLLKRQALAHGTIPPTEELVSKAAQILGGNPLTLRLAAPVLHAKGKTGLSNLSKLREDVRQKQLVSRIVTHLHDKNLDKLLLPGLEVRVITPDIMRHVLAKPCKLGSLTEAETWTLFDKMRREVALVEPERDNAVKGAEALRYRQDIRLIMVSDQQGRLTAKARQIHENAVAWWQQQNGSLAKAEELYHRLRLGQPPAKLESHWDAEAGRLLRSTLDELPAKSRQYIWLANKLKVGLETARTARLGHADWERQTATEVERLLRGQQPEQALTLLARRSRRLPGSRLYALESRAHLFAGKERRAAAIARKGIAACKNDFKPMAVDLALLAAFIYERQGQFPTADRMAAQAVNLAQATADGILILSALLRSRRLQRLAWEREGRKGRLPPAAPGLEAAALAVGDHKLRQNPSVLRELANELGASHPKFLKLAADVLLEDLLKAQPVDQLVQWLSRLGMITAEEHGIFRAAGRRHEITSLARKRIDERLHVPFTTNLVPFYEALRDLFRADANAALHKQYQTRKTEPTATGPSGSRTGAPNPGLQELITNWRKRLIGVLSRLDAKSRSTIMRVVLESDDALLSRGRASGTAVATDLFDHALKLQRLPDLLHSLKSLLRGSDLQIVKKSLIDLAAVQADSLRPPRPLPPLPKSVAENNIQKGRWGRKSTGFGFKLYVENVSEERKGFYFDAVLENRGSTPMAGPFFFHVHDDFKTPVRITKVQANRAVMAGNWTEGTYTLGVQFKDAQGTWQSLEYDLAKWKKGRLTKYS